MLSSEEEEGEYEEDEGVEEEERGEGGKEEGGGGAKSKRMKTDETGLSTSYFEANVKRSSSSGAGNALDELDFPDDAQARTLLSGQPPKHSRELQQLLQHYMRRFRGGTFNSCSNLISSSTATARKEPCWKNLVGT